ncbi:fluoride efflux transporter CrcB [Sphingomicrobium lutaoense]|uniref:Fluoride-specific ion channel FluC n=1 Tax=Sphingomicrobium lutaoense TaxID=515949 RepID=A0A839Z501_9SPHN|nr:fluoride efflux transporter CrcB [Sphingomicrobium lutaoense]MBB3764953.1 CrcB protein [Sphingomicrobium lutaoense]
MNALAVFLGGGLGALLRWLVGKWSIGAVGTAFPIATLSVNLAGSLAIGLAIGALDGVGHTARLFFVTGVLGGFTTYSAFSLDALTLWQRGQSGLAALYVLLTLVGGLGACAAGYQLAR